MALTGGYRRTPVMQIGADIYCDTALICEVLDALAPTPALYPPEQAAAARLAAAWFDTALFTASVTYVFQPAGVASMLGHLSPAQVQAFAADRKAMRGDTNALRMPLAEASALLHETFGSLEAQFAAGVAHVAGPALSVGDFSLYHNLWFIRRAGALAQALDEGVSADGGLQAGDPVTVTPTDYARDPVAGVLLSLTPRRVTLRRQDPRAGALNVHFPRQGYQVQRAG
ncbi:hypothetical protein D3C72_1676810 [compost metagenome]